MNPDTPDNTAVSPVIVLISSHYLNSLLAPLVKIDSNFILYLNFGEHLLGFKLSGFIFHVPCFCSVKTLSCLVLVRGLLKASQKLNGMLCIKIYGNHMRIKRVGDVSENSIILSIADRNPYTLLTMGRLADEVLFDDEPYSIFGGVLNRKRYQITQQWFDEHYKLNN